MTDITLPFVRSYWVLPEKLLARHGYATGTGVLTKLSTLIRHTTKHFGEVPEAGAQRTFVTNWRAGA